LKILARANDENAAAACTFCDAKISYGQSICSDCMKKYDIRASNLGNDGCGCDK